MAGASEDALVRTTASAAVADRLRSEIQSGELSPGARLRQADVATRFAVSTTPVREAFQILQAEGLLRIDPHRGAIVFRPTVDEMREAFEMRIVLEQLAISKAIPNITHEVLSELEAHVQRMQASNDPAEWRRLNTIFHLRIYESSERPRLVAAIRNLSDATSGYSQMATLRQPRSWWSDTQHSELLEAIRARDVDRAKAIIEEHLNLTVSVLVEVLESSGGGIGEQPTTAGAPI